MSDLLHAVRVPSWGLSVTGAAYYGYGIGMHAGPWLVFAFPAPTN